ncbi:MAG: ribosome maturation factor RimM [Armatimonadota bacterium]|nr:ribosome maturation factor RimM [Armatimonadota bacterium]MDR5697955.1 ribosome maturation factor RimM [Armatimonadota bacterium]
MAGPTGRPAPRTLRIGVVMRPHGIHGEVRVRPDTDFPDRFRTLRRVLVVRGDRTTAYGVERVRSAGETFLVKLTGVDTPETARELSGASLHVEREDAPPLPEGRFYVHDVIGMEVTTTDGEPLGWVAEVLRTGANDVYAVRGGGREVLIPAVRDVVAELDPRGGRMVVRLIPGLVDDR